MAVSFTVEWCCANVELQFVSTESSPESTFLSVGWNDNFIIDGRLPIIGLQSVQENSSYRKSFLSLITVRPHKSINQSLLF